MVAALRRFARVDDDDPDDLYDPEWLARGKKVVRDGGVVRTSIMLMDGVPNPRLMLNDASRHRPHQLPVIDSAARREAEDAYQAHKRWLADAWRSPSNPPPPPLRDGQSPRDQYIERVTNAWRTPPRRNDPADDVEALQRRWASPGATPGRRPTQDAAAGRAEADQAYEEYCAHLQSAWKTR